MGVKVRIHTHAGYILSLYSRPMSPRGRRNSSGYIYNFYIHYEVDDDEVPTVLELAAYDGADEGCWVLLQQV